MTSVTTTGADVGRTCPYCRFPLKEASVAECCDSCNSLHHEDCWKDGGGCSVLGCAGAGTASQVGAGTPAGSPSPQQGATQLPPTQPVTKIDLAPLADHQPQQPAGPPGTRSAGNQLILVISVVIATVGIGTGALVATGALSRKATPVTVAAGRLSSQSGSAPSTVPSQTEVSSDRNAIMGVLSAYERAYSDHDTQGLGGIFMPHIVRHGLAAGGCTVSHGRGAVLADYSSQFAEGSGSYRLVGLSPGQIRVDSATSAHIHANYVITPGGSGWVNFRFATLGSEWKISEVYATCA